MNAEEQDAFWERYYLESPIKDIEVIDSAAKQLITVTSLLQGIYFASMSLSDFKKQAATWQLALLLAPAVLWLLSLFFAVVTFIPASRHISRDSAHDDLVRISQQKFRNLRVSYYILLISLVTLLVNVLMYLLWSPSPPPVTTIP